MKLKAYPMLRLFIFYVVNQTHVRVSVTLPGKDRAVSSRSTKHFSLWFIPAVLLTMTDKVFLRLCAGLKRVLVEIWNSRTIVRGSQSFVLHVLCHQVQKKMLRFPRKLFY